MKMSKLRMIMSYLHKVAHPLVMPKEDQSELLAVLDRELEGRSRKAAAQQLELPEGALSSLNLVRR